IGILHRCQQKASNAIVLGGSGHLPLVYLLDQDSHLVVIARSNVTNMSGGWVKQAHIVRFSAIDAAHKTVTAEPACRGEPNEDKEGSQRETHRPAAGRHAERLCPGHP